MVKEVIVVKNLTKIYPDGTVAIKNINLTIGSDCIFSLLGRNGAGKTTFIRILSTQLMPTEGEVKILGYDIIKDAEKIREHIAVLPQEAKPDPSLTPYEHIYYFLRIRGVSKSEAEEKTKKWLQELELWKYKDRPTGILSGGLKRRVLLAMVFATNADILFLDEPTVGVDPISRRLLWSYIRMYKRLGKTIVLTTHYIDEAEFLADKIAIIHKGEILAEGEVDNIKKIINSKYAAVIENYDNRLSKIHLDKFGKALKFGFTYYVYFDNYKDVELFMKEMLKLNLDIRVRPVNLEDVFIKLIKEE